MFENELPRSHHAPWLARRLLTEQVGTALEHGDLHTAKLLTSELVTNAVLHGRGRILLRAGLDSDRLRVEVIDEGEGFAHEASREGLKDRRGRGLAIVDSESTRWGVQPGSTNVWFELEP